jgi:hypothetical protein
MKTKKMEAGGMAKMATINKPKKGFLPKGEVPSPDEGYRGKRHLPVLLGRGEKMNPDDMESQIKDMIHEGANKDYKEEAGVQDSINNPLVRGARKAATYVKEKYGDIRDDVRTAVTGDDSAKYRGMTRKAREGHLGYSKGGSVSSASSRADGAAKKGKTKGRTL